MKNTHKAIAKTSGIFYTALHKETPVCSQKLPENEQFRRVFQVSSLKALPHSLFSPVSGSVTRTRGSIVQAEIVLVCFDERFTRYTVFRVRAS